MEFFRQSNTPRKRRHESGESTASNSSFSSGGSCALLPPVSRVPSSSSYTHKAYAYEVETTSIKPMAVHQKRNRSSEGDNVGSTTSQTKKQMTSSATTTKHSGHNTRSSTENENLKALSTSEVIYHFTRQRSSESESSHGSKDIVVDKTSDDANSQPLSGRVLRR